MKRVLSANKATKCFLDSPQYHRTLFSSLYSGHSYSSSRIINASESLQRLPDGNKNVDVEIISRETIKPSSPTPQHLKTFNLSILDQFMIDVYTPFAFFLPNSNKESVTHVVNKRSKHLKETLSEIMTRFYPFAGKVKDNLQIECNDEGVYYIEARVNQTLQNFLRHPDDEKVRGLLPESPKNAGSSIGNYVIRVQVNIFKCGGIGLSTSVSHKIIDGHTYYMLMKAWAAAARGSSKTISPSFVGTEIFPNNPCLEYSLPSKILTTKPLSTKRFVFDSNALALLKEQAVASPISTLPPTRVEATTSIIWKAAAQAATKIRPFGPQSPHVLLSMVNLRNRASPPLPEESIGNLVIAAGTVCYPCCQLDLPTLMGQQRESIAKIDKVHIESLKGEKGHETFNEILRTSNQLMDVTSEGDCLVATSLLNSGIYDLDFGWGKPIWFYAMNNGMVRRVALNETLKASGVEAIVTLSPDEMEIFECNPELLSYATVDPSPLRFEH